MRSAPVLSNASGEFLFVDVSPDTYTVEITMLSFITLQRRNVAVSAGARVAVGTLTLERGLYWAFNPLGQETSPEPRR